MAGIVKLPLLSSYDQSWVQKWSYLTNEFYMYKDTVAEKCIKDQSLVLVPYLSFKSYYLESSTNETATNCLVFDNETHHRPCNFQEVL